MCYFQSVRFGLVPWYSDLGLVFWFGPILKLSSSTLDLGVSCRSDLEIGACGGVDKCLVLCSLDTGRDLRRLLFTGHRIIGVFYPLKYF